MPTAKIHIGDCRSVLKALPDESIHCVVTSPPYFGLRDYGVDGQIGLEQTPDEYVREMVQVFREVRRVLRDDGTLWLNLGDSYASSVKGSGGTEKGTIARGKGQGTNAGAFFDVRRFDLAASGLKPKDLIGIPWRVAFALQADGWYLRQDIIWHKPNPMPESVTDRCTKAHEYIFLLSKSERYSFNAEAIREDAARPEWMYEAATQPGNQDRRDGGCTQRKVKERGHARIHQGFADRWDAMSKHEQAASGRNKRSVWSIATHPFPDAHFATFPPSLIEPCILAGCPEGGSVLDPFSGAGTTGLVALAKGRGYIGIELNEAYADMSRRRIELDAPMFNQVEIVWHKAAEAV